MRPPTMSGHCLLAPIPESSSDYLLPKDIKLAVLGAGRVGKSGECPGGRAGTTAPRGRDGALGGGEEDRAPGRTWKFPRRPRLSPSSPLSPRLPRGVYSWAPAWLGPCRWRGAGAAGRHLQSHPPQNPRETATAAPLALQSLSTWAIPAVLRPSALSFSTRASRFDWFVLVLYLIFLFFLFSDDCALSDQEIHWRL